MKEYFLHNGQQQLGPFSLKELKLKGINAKTMIWHKGISDWTQAGELEDLKEIITEVPPPFSNKRETPPPFENARKVFDKDYINEIENKIPNKSGKKVFKIALIILAFIGLIVVIGKILPSEERSEKNNPMDFISVDGAIGSVYQSNYDRDYEGNGVMSIEGKIINKANKTKYKDFIIDVQCFSKTKTPLGNQQYTLYDEIEPDSEKTINTKLEGKAPEGTSEIKWTVIGATGVNIE